MKTYALFFCLILTGCAGFAQQTASVCPPIRNYTALEQDRIAAAMDMLPSDSALEQPLLEWESLRLQLRTCHL